MIRILMLLVFALAVSGCGMLGTASGIRMDLVSFDAHHTFLEKKSCKQDSPTQTWTTPDVFSTYPITHHGTIPARRKSP